MSGVPRTCTTMLEYIRLESVECSSLNFFHFHLVQIYMYFYEYLGRLPIYMQAAIVEEGWEEWLIRLPSWARMSSQRGPRIGVRAECGVRNAECGGRMCVERSGSAECGVRPAGVCGAGRCRRSAECGSCGVRTAHCRAGRYPRSADRGVLRTHAEYGVLLFNYRQAALSYLGRQRWEWLRFPSRPTRSAAAETECGMWDAARVKTYGSCNRLAASFPPTRILERSLATSLIVQYTYLNTDNPFHKIPTLFGPILSFLHFPRFPLVPV